MKQWLKRTQSPGGRSPSRSREFRQVITRLTTGFPAGHCLAYCLVSKESSYGIFLNERLLVLDTLKRELRYYSHIPSLPLQHPSELPAPKEVAPVRPGLEFQLEKVRIGHVSVRWEEHRQPRLWKLIMGSNQIAKEFEAIVLEVLQAETELAKANETPIAKEYRVPRPQEAAQQPHQEAPRVRESSRVRENPVGKTESLLMTTPPRQERFEAKDLIKEGSSQRLNISLHDSRPREQAEGYLSSRYKPLDIHPSPKLIKEDNSLQRSGLMAAEWLYARDDSERAAVYNRFVRVCSRKVELLMENFIAGHLMHEERDGLHLIRDNDIEVYYAPLIDSTEDEPLSVLLGSAQQEAAMLEKWQSFNYLSGFRHTQSLQMLLPMACLITHKSFRFFCKNSLEMYPHKRQLSPYQFDQELAALEQATHLPIRNGKEEIYLIELENAQILYFDHLSCLPKITPFLPVSPTYAELFLTRGVVSNQKDIEAISEHITTKLLIKTLQNLGRKSLATSCEVMDFICESGLSHHYLGRLLKEADAGYVQRLLGSELVACAAEWEIRRRMQVELFKKREFGFAVNQVRMAVALLLQEDPYFIAIVREIATALFDFTPPQPLASFIEPQAMVISLFHRLGFDCRGAFLDADQMETVWSPSYINDYIELTPLLNAELLRHEAFSPQHPILKTLISETNYQINTEVGLEAVLNALGLRKNSSGLYSVSNSYSILPQGLRMKVNYYLSHFIAPSFEPAPQQSLQALIYGDSFAPVSGPHYYTHTLQHLTTLNKIRWLARMKYFPRVEQLLEREVEQATTWSQLPLLIQVYSFAGKVKLRQGEIGNALECSLKALQWALRQYEREGTVLMELVIAEQAFEAGNLHFSCHNFTKALDLYCTVEQILGKVSSSTHNVTLNPEFLELFVNKCSIHLLFGDYAECLKQCLASLQSCRRFHGGGQQEFKIYEILFRCYQIKNMRKEVVEVACACSQKYFEELVFAGQQPSLPILGALIKMLWVSLIKQVEALSTTRSPEQPQSAKLKTIYLKKVRKEAKQLRDALSDSHRYSAEEAATFLARKVLKYPQPPEDCRSTAILTDCLSEVSLNSRSLQSSRLYDRESLENQWLVLQMLGVLAGYDFLVGSIDDYLRVYDFLP